MPLTVDQMTVAELQAVIRERKKLAKKIPALRKERAALTLSLAEIDAKLAQFGAGFRQKRGVAKAAATAAKPMGRPPKAKGPKSVAGKRLPRGSVQAAILAVLAAGPKSPSEITGEISATRIKGISSKSVSVAIDKMKKAGKIVNVERGIYKAV